MGTDGFRAPELHFEDAEMASSKIREPDIFSFGVSIFALATNGLIPWHPTASLSNFARNCSSLEAFIHRMSQQHDEQQLNHQILDQRTGCVFIACQGESNPPVHVITRLAWLVGSPNTSVRL
jgi:serine/threonine protein kinase